MKILSIDTASNVCGVSILDNKKSLCFLDTNTGRTHSENLMPMVQEAFEKTNLKLSDMDLLVCDLGPGSFTGIRIGVATVKAFADSLNIPCSGISSLKTLAYNLIDDSCESDVVCSIIDCKNDNCYFALYEFKDGVCSNVINPTADTVEHSLELLKDYSNILFVGDGALIYSDLISNSFDNCHFIDDNSANELNSVSLAMAGYDYFSKNGSDKDLLPLYLRKPQAQRQLEEKLANKL